MAAQQIPVIDIADLDDGATLAAIDSACRQWGAFQVTGHGIGEDLIDGLYSAMLAFFRLPAEDKQAISRSLDNPWGYFDRELTLNTRDWKEIFDYGPGGEAGQVPQWPGGLPAFRPAVLAYYDACEALALRLVGALERNLGAEPGSISRHFTGVHTSYLRLNYYPRCPDPVVPEGEQPAAGGHLALNPHRDAGALTLLLQDEQPGLQVYDGARWQLVEPVSGAVVVNLGDMLQVWSNDQYHAPLHRVLANPSAQRFSAPYFYNPSYDTDCVPLPATVDAEHPARYRVVNWGEFRRLRAQGDYGDYGDEVQISQYRISGG